MVVAAVLMLIAIIHRARVIRAVLRLLRIDRIGFALHCAVLRDAVLGAERVGYDRAGRHLQWHVA